LNSDFPHQIPGLYLYTTQVYVTKECKIKTKERREGVRMTAANGGLQQYAYL